MVIVVCACHQYVIHASNISHWNFLVESHPLTEKLRLPKQLRMVGGVLVSPWLILMVSYFRMFSSNTVCWYACKRSSLENILSPAMQGCKQVFWSWQWILVNVQCLIDCDLVVPTNSEIAILLWNRDSRCHPFTGVYFLDYSCLFPTIQLFSHSFLDCEGNQSRPSEFWIGIFKV